MDQFVSAVQLALLQIANGCLALIYVSWTHGAALLAMAGIGWLARSAPTVQRGWMVGVGLLAGMAGLLAPPPVPALLAGMCLLGAGAVQLDRFQPDALRWRVVGGLPLSAGAALGYLAYSRYLAGVDAAAWAAAIGGQAEAQATLAQGQAFLNTLATWGLWLILPLGFLSLLGQGLLVHPPLQHGPAATISAVRTRGRDR